MKLTQQQIAYHLDMSQKSVSQFLAKEGLDCRTSTLDEIRVAYLRRLRAYGNEGQQELTHERVLTERVDRELKVYQLEQKKAQLVNVTQLEEELKLMVGVIKTTLLQSDQRLRNALNTLYGIESGIELFNQYSSSALKHFGRFYSGDALSE